MKSRGLALAATLWMCGLVISPGLGRAAEAKPAATPAGDSAAPTEGESQFCQLAGRQCPVIRLWPPGQAPDEPHPLKPECVITEGRDGRRVFMITNVSEPSMLVLPAAADKNTGVALLFAPGGGYGGLGADLVKEIADWFNPRGVTCVLLKYRVPKRHEGYEMHYQPLQDAQRAMGILRSRAAEWGIDPHKIGMAGASAGGNLAACLVMNHDRRWYKPIDEWDRTSCRPDFGLLLYPAYLTDPIISRQRVLKLGYERIRTPDTPPTLITITYPDKFTFGCMEFYLALQAAHVPAELHVYPEGGHGGGIERYPFGQWALECMRFLQEQKFLPVPEGQPSAPDAGGTSVPGEKVALDAGRGTLTVLRPGPAANGRAVVIRPDDASADSLAAAARLGNWLGTVGMTAILLEPAKQAAGSSPDDLPAAVKFVRSQAEKWRIDPLRIGVCGIGRGAPAAALAAATAIRTRDSLDPAFAILLSPQGLGDPAHPGQPDPRLVALHRTSPPIFVALSGTDPGLPALADYYLAAEPTRVLAECHVYEATDPWNSGRRAPAWEIALARWIKDLDGKPEPHESNSLR